MDQVTLQERETKGQQGAHASLAALRQGCRAARTRALAWHLSHLNVDRLCDRLGVAPEAQARAPLQQALQPLPPAGRGHLAQRLRATCRGASAPGCAEVLRASAGLTPEARLEVLELASRLARLAGPPGGRGGQAGAHADALQDFVALLSAYRGPRRRLAAQAAKLLCHTSQGGAAMLGALCRIPPADLELVGQALASLTPCAPTRLSCMVERAVGCRGSTPLGSCANLPSLTRAISARWSDPEARQACLLMLLVFDPSIRLYVLTLADRLTPGRCFAGPPATLYAALGRLDAKTLVGVGALLVFSAPADDETAALAALVQAVAALRALSPAESLALYSRAELPLAPGMGLPELTGRFARRWGKLVFVQGRHRARFACQCPPLFTSEKILEAADVYRGKDRTDGSLWAFKNLANYVCCDCSASETLRREALLARHAGAAMAPLRLLCSPTDLMLQMPLMAGNLEQFANATREHTSRADVVTGTWLGIRSLLRDVVVTHAQGIAHRDIKPANVFHRRTHTSVRLGDFGVAVPCHQYNHDNRGTPDFMAPEQFSAQHNMQGSLPPSPPAADVYGVGSTTFYLLTHYVIHRAATRQMLAHFVDARSGEGAEDEEAVGALPQIFAQLPSSTTHLLLAMMHPQPWARPTAAAALAAVDALLADEPPERRARGAALWTKL